MKEDFILGQKVRRIEECGGPGPGAIGIVKVIPGSGDIGVDYMPNWGPGLWWSRASNLRVVEDPLVAATVEALKGSTPKHQPLLPTEAAERKKFPVATGVLDYFPSALLQVAYVSYMGNFQHNPGQPLHHARGKSMDQEDTTIRHFMERTVSDDNNITSTLTKDSDGTYHLAKAIWRMLATFQIQLEAEGAPLARGARLPEEKK